MSYQQPSSSLLINRFSVDADSYIDVKQVDGEVCTEANKIEYVFGIRLLFGQNAANVIKNFATVFGIENPCYELTETKPFEFWSKKPVEIANVRVSQKIYKAVYDVLIGNPKKILDKKAIFGASDEEVANNMTNSFLYHKSTRFTSYIGKTFTMVHDNGEIYVTVDDNGKLTVVETEPDTPMFTCKVSESIDKLMSLYNTAYAKLLYDNDISYTEVICNLTDCYTYLTDSIHNRGEKCVIGNCQPSVMVWDIETLFKNNNEVETPITNICLKYVNQVKKEAYNVMIVNSAIKETVLFNNFNTKSDFVGTVSDDTIDNAFYKSLTDRLDASWDFPDAEPLKCYEGSRIIEHEYNCCVVTGSESDTIATFLRAIAVLKPVVISGFNDSGFDWPMLDKRIEALTLSPPKDSEATHLYFKQYVNIFNVRANLRTGRIKESKFKVSATKDVECKTPPSNNTVFMDVMNHLRKLENTQNRFSLNFFLDLYGLGSKNDVSYAQMAEWFCSKDVNGMTKTSVYCMVDVNKTYELIVKKDLIGQKHQLGALINVPFTKIANSSNNFAIRHLLLEYGTSYSFSAKTLNPIINKQSDTGKYEGAYVLEPHTGLKLQSPVAALDFSSLYPSIMLTYNISHDALIDTRFSPEMKTEHVDRLSASQLENRPLTEFVDANHKLCMDEVVDEIIDNVQCTRFKSSANYFRLVNKGTSKGLILNILEDLLVKRKESKRTYEQYKNKTEEKAVEEGDIGYDFLNLAKAEVMKSKNIEDADNEVVEDNNEVVEDNIEVISSDKLSAQEEFLMNEANSKQLAVKVLMNSIYGTMGFQLSTIYKLEFAEVVTQMGRILLKTCTEVVKRQGYVVEYGDTDSMYISIPHDDPRLLMCDTLVDTINSRIDTTRSVIGELQILINNLLSKLTGDKILKMAYEEVLYPALFISKKIYTGIKHENHNVSINYMRKSSRFVKGHSSIKSSASGLDKILWLTFFSKVLSYDTLEAFFEYSVPPKYCKLVEDLILRNCVLLYSKELIDSVQGFDESMFIKYVSAKRSSKTKTAGKCLALKSDNFEENCKVPYDKAKFGPIQEGSRVPVVLTTGRSHLQFNNTTAESVSDRYETLDFLRTFDTSISYGEYANLFKTSIKAVIPRTVSVLSDMELSTLIFHLMYRDAFVEYVATTDAERKAMLQKDIYDLPCIDMCIKDYPKFVPVTHAGYDADKIVEVADEILVLYNQRSMTVDNKKVNVFLNNISPDFISTNAGMLLDELSEQHKQLFVNSTLNILKDKLTVHKLVMNINRRRKELYENKTSAKYNVTKACILDLLSSKGIECAEKLHEYDTSIVIAFIDALYNKVIETWNK